MSPRASIVRSGEIEYSFWLVFDETGGMRFARTEPNCDRGEHKMAMLATLPRSLWRTPSLRGTITLTDPGAPPIAIDVEAAQSALRSVTGLDIDVRIVGPDNGQT